MKQVLVQNILSLEMVLLVLLNHDVLQSLPLPDVLHLNLVFILVKRLDSKLGMTRELEMIVQSSL